MKRITLFGIIALVLIKTSIGQNEYQWVHTDGPPGGAPGGGIAFVYSNSSYAFIPSGDFLFRSNDGVSWEKLNQEVGYLCGVDDDRIVNLFRDSSGIMRIRLSKNNGQSWEIKGIPSSITYHGSIAVCSHGIYIAQGNYSLLFQSANDGETWSSVSPPFEYGHDLYSFDDRIFLSNSSALWHTDQNGENWKNISPPVQDFNDYISDVQVINESIFVSGEENVFYSNDFGATWSNFEIPQLNISSKLAVTGNEVYLYSRDLFRSDDFGNSWEMISDRSENPLLLKFTGFKGQFISTAYNKGIFRWDNALSQLVENNEGYSKGVIYDLSAAKDQIWTACGNGVFSYNVTTNAWNNKSDLPRSVFQYQKIDASENGWVVTYKDYDDYFYFSQDGGINWDSITPMANGETWYVDNVKVLGDELYVFSQFNILTSADKGNTWKVANLGSSNNALIEFKNKHFISFSNKYFYSDNVGETWNQLEVQFQLVKLFPAQDKLFAVASNQSGLAELFVSSDGISWTASSSVGLPPINAFDIELGSTDIHFFKNKNKYFSFWGNKGLYVSTDTLRTWNPLDINLYGRTYLTYKNVVYLGKNGLYKSDVFDPYLTSSREIEKAEHKIELYPNPSCDHLMIY